MPTVPIISPGTRGVDGKSDPFTLGTRKLAHAVNLSFNEGSIKTRSGFYYRSMGIKGQFQGNTLYCPSMGTSVESFGHCGAQFATAVSGGIYLNGITRTSVSCTAVKIEGTEITENCETKDPRCRGDINLFQAENYLIVHNRLGPTYWWDGAILTPSPGMTADASQDELRHSHDTIVWTEHKNFLVNGAGLGIYAHHRIHQQGGNKVYISDILHKRGNLATDDILLMEEQSLGSCGPPLTVASRMGSLMALAISPKMQTPYGEGVLVAYYEGGVETFNTFAAPRETRIDPDTGEAISQGWDTKPLSDTVLNMVSATGRYAVATLPRDQIFRSPLGVHLLSQVVGTETISDEPANVISSEVEPVLRQDDLDSLGGVACGYWIRGQRYFVTTGMRTDEHYSSASCGKAFVSWNKVWKRTEDKTPLPAWDGVWTLDNGMFGVHRFSHLGLRQDEGDFGFICSDNDQNIYFASILPDSLDDNRGGVDIPIQWAFETGRFAFGGLSKLTAITDARFEGVFASSQACVRILIRTDRKATWQRWREYRPCDRVLQRGQRLLKAEPLGKPPEGYREAVWFEFRVEGTGYAEIRSFEADVSVDQNTSGKGLCVIVDCPEKDYLTSVYE